MPESNPTPILFNCKHCGKEFEPHWTQRKRGEGCCSKSCGSKSRPYPKKPLSDRFWKHVDKIDDENSCWEWTGAKLPTGYGHVGLDGEMVYSHRVAWEFEHGPIPKGLHVCHHCDNPSCVRAFHLFLGTHADNMRDCKDKGRYRSSGLPGEQCGNSKLTDVIVLNIRERHAKGGVKLTELAKEYGVKKSAICKIVHGKTWRHLLPQPPSPDPAPLPKPAPT